MNEDNNAYKHNITKEDAINVLESMMNDKNKKSVNMYINKISSVQDIAFQEELDKNDIETLEDVKRYFEGKLIEEIEIPENDEIEKEEFEKCMLDDLDIDDTYFHFTDKEYLESTKDNGLVSDVGKHSKGIDEKPSIFFSSGMVATIQGTDVWIKWAMNRMYGEKNQFHIYDGLDESVVKSKQSEWFKEFLNKEYLNDGERKEKAFEMIFDSLKGKSFLTVDLKPGIDFSLDDIDYTKQRALNSKENGDMIAYLMAKEMYGDYSDFDSTKMDKWNMHTFWNAQVEPERIMQVTDSKGRTDMLNILIEMYDKCKSKDCQFDILDDFISYARQRELEKGEISKQTEQSYEKNSDDLEKESYSITPNAIGRNTVYTNIGKKDMAKNVVDRKVEERTHPQELDPHNHNRNQGGSAYGR